MLGLLILLHCIPCFRLFSTVFDATTYEYLSPTQMIRNNSSRLKCIFTLCAAVALTSSRVAGTSAFQHQAAKAPQSPPTSSSRQKHSTGAKSKSKSKSAVSNGSIGCSKSRNHMNRLTALRVCQSDHLGFGYRTSSNHLHANVHANVHANMHAMAVPLSGLGELQSSSLFRKQLSTRDRKSITSARRRSQMLALQSSTMVRMFVKS